MILLLLTLWCQALKHYRVVSFPRNEGAVLVLEAITLVVARVFPRFDELAPSSAYAHGLLYAAEVGDVDVIRFQW